QYLKEKTFVAQYKKLFSSFRRQIQSDRAKYEFDNHDSITDIFLSFTGSAPASTEQKSTALLVHEDCFSALMDSQLADQLDVATTAICRAPDSFFSNIESMEDMLHTDAPLREEDGQKNEPAQDEQCPITVKAECDYASKKAFNTFAFLEQFQYRGDGLGRYYFYTSTPGYNYCHYSHDYLFHVLNLFEKNDTPKNGQIYPSEIDILPIGEVFPKSVEKEILSMEGRKSIRLHLGDALNKYYSRACRLIPGACSARCGNKFIVPKNGTVKACFHGQQIGTTCNTAAEMRQKIASVVEDVEKSRGCAQCPAFEYCPRCLYLADHESYCRLLKRHPHTFRIFSLYDFLRRLENYEIDLAKDSQITIKISVAANRCLLPSLEAPLVKSDQPTYRVNKHLLPAVVENKCYVYNVSDGTIIKLTAIAFLVLEVVEAYRIDPLSIAGCRFSYNDTGMLTKEQIIKATNTLVKNQLITVSSKEI
ncbi:MAG: hypothetical protein GY765_38340, partial [bacterium]|nr:hypothetical protein [bacterium]